MACLLIAPVSFAQLAQGSLGATSTGNIDLDLQVTDSVKITALADIDFGSYGGADTGAISGADAYCVYTNGGDAYKITPTSTNGAATDDANTFHLVGTTDGDEIQYTIKFAGTATGASSAATVPYNTQTASFNGANTTNCAGADNAQLHIDIAETEIRAASTDLYTDMLILLVNPV